MRAPDYIEPVVGWRMWCTVGDDEGTVLRSVNRRTVWPRGTALVADCLRSRIHLWRRSDAHAAPGPECRCGIYASDIALLRAYLAEWLVWGGCVPVLGTVSLWGRVFEHERGWRAQCAYPQHLFVPVVEAAPEQALSAAQDLAAYGVPVSLVAATTLDTVLHDAVAAA
jgi:hypothetical protein